MNLTALDRHCPKCQANARDRWLEARRQQLLPSYVHVVFTLPHELVPLALQNERIFYSLLLQTSADTLLEIARDPRHLGAEIGFFSVLHTWNQKLELHPHAHCVVPAGGLSLDRSHWIQARSAFCLPVKVLSRLGVSFSPLCKRTSAKAAQGKTLLPHHPDHPDSPFSSSSNCSRGASHSPQPIEFA